MSRPLFTPGKDLVPIVQEAGQASGPVWTGAENLAPTGIRSPDRPARRQSLYRLRYPAHGSRVLSQENSLSVMGIRGSYVQFTSQSLALVPIPRHINLISNVTFCYLFRLVLIYCWYMICPANIYGNGNRNLTWVSQVNLVFVPPWMPSRNLFCVRNVALL